MSKKPVLYRCLVIGVIVLFIGVGVQPAIATVETKKSDSDDDCNLCPSLNPSRKQICELIMGLLIFVGARGVLYGSIANFLELLPFKILYNIISSLIYIRLLPSLPLMYKLMDLVDEYDCLDFWEPPERI